MPYKRSYRKGGGRRKYKRQSSSYNPIDAMQLDPVGLAAAAGLSANDAARIKGLKKLADKVNSVYQHRGDGSATIAGTKKRKVGQATPDGTGGTYSNFTLYAKYQKRVPLGQNITNVLVGSGYLSNSTGDVAWRTNNYDWNNTDYATMKALANDVATSTARMFIKGLYTRTTYENLDPGNVDLVIYDIVATSETPTAYQDPVDAIRDGIDVEGGTSVSYLVPGFRPENSVFFRKNFKVVQEKRLTLGPGRRHVHHFRHVINKWLEDQDIRSGDTVHFPWITTFQVTSIKGPIVMDSTDNTQIAYGKGKVTFVAEKRYNCIMASDLRRISSATNNTVDPTTAAQHINPNTGAVIADIVSAEAGAV